MMKTLTARRKYSEDRLRVLRSRIAAFEVLRDLPDLCIYVTGSYGRLEASEHSDIDLFFINKGSDNKSSGRETTISRIDKTLLDAELIKTVRDLGYPDFSKDGQYLTVHYVDDVKQRLGSPEDDFENHFTARLLMLLESRCLFNKDVYNDALNQMLHAYFRDYTEHSASFRPLFLLNDILRFWRTLCLNYEHRRHGDDNEGDKNEDRLLNLKLIFVRLLTCHSAVAMLCLNGESTDCESVREIIGMSPLERLEQIAERKSSLSGDISALKESYDWFLLQTGRKKEDVLRWIGDDDNWCEARNQRRTFANTMYRVICKASSGSEIKRFLVE